MLTTILASQEPAPELIDLGVFDFNTNSARKVAGMEGWDGDYMQAQVLSYSPLVFGSLEPGHVAGNMSRQYWVRRFSKVACALSFSDPGASAVIRPVYIDKNNVPVLGEDQVVDAAGFQYSDSSYAAGVLVLPSLGASKVQFYIESISAGTVNLRAAGI